MKLTLKERKQVKEYAKKLVEGRTELESGALNLIARMEKIKKMMKDRGYDVSDRRK